MAGLSDPFVNLQLAAVATGDGTRLQVDQYGGAILNITGTFVGTVTFEGTVDRLNWYSVEAWNLATGAKATTATTTGIFILSTPGAIAVRARISAYTSGEITVTGRPTPVSAVVLPSAGGSGGTSSTFGAALPTTGTAAGLNDGTNMQAPRVFDADTGGGTEYLIGVLLRQSGSGGSSELGTASLPLRIDPTGTTAQPSSQSGTWTVQPGNTANTTAWKVDGSAVTQPVSLASVPSHAVTGPLTDTELRASAVPVSLASVPSHAVTNAGTFATQATLQAGTAEIGKLAAGTANIGDVDVLTVPAPLSTTGGGVELATLRVTIASDSTGVLSVDDNGANISVDWGGTVPPIGAGTEAAALRVTLASDSTGVLSVDDNAGSLTIDGTVTANAGTGTFQVGDAGAVINLDASGDVQADVLTLPNVTLAAGTNTNEVVGDAAHDAAAAGNPVLVGGFGETMADSAPGNRASADSDVVRLAVDLDGALYTHPHGPQTWSYHEDSSNALTDAEVHAAPAAGLSLYVGTIIVSTGAATAMNIFFEEGASKVLGPWYLEAIAGRGAPLVFNPPKKITAATALTVTTSAAIAHSIDITGFTAPG